MLWIALPLVAALCARALMWMRGSRARNMLAGLPTFPQLPVLGNVHQFYGNNRHIFKIIDKMTQIIEKTELPFAFWLGPNPVILVYDPEDVKAVTNTLVEKPYLYSFGRAWLGNGLVTAEGCIWKRNIKKLSGTFTTSTVDGYQVVFNAQAQRLVAGLKTKVGSQPFDCMHYLANATLEAICQTAFGVPLISESVVTHEYYQAFNRALYLLVRRGLNLLYHSEFVYRLTPSYRELMKNVAILHNVSGTVIKKRLKQLEDNKINNAMVEPDPVDGNKTQFTSVLDMLLELRKNDPSWTEQQIRSEVDTMIVGGQETVASTLFYALLAMGYRTDVQEELYAEMKEIYNDSNRPVTKDDLSRMKYCEAVILETLRLFPPIPCIMRLADKDVELNSCTVPAGTFVGVSAWGAGRSERAWGPTAKEFNPQRWLDDDIPTSGASFLAFSYGRRACIGKKYAMAILKTCLAHCIRNLQFWSQADKLELAFDLALRPYSGHLMEVTLRE